jgi:hypothetical protein
MMDEIRNQYHAEIRSWFPHPRNHEIGRDPYPEWTHPAWLAFGVACLAGWALAWNLLTPESVTALPPQPRRLQRNKYLIFVLTSIALTVTVNTLSWGTSDFVLAYETLGSFLLLVILMMSARSAPAQFLLKLAGFLLLTALLLKSPLRAVLKLKESHLDKNDYSPARVEKHVSMSVRLEEMAPGSTCLWLVMVGDSNMRGIAGEVERHLRERMGWRLAITQPTICVHHDAFCAHSDKDSYFIKPAVKGMIGSTVDNISLRVGQGNRERSCLILSRRFVRNDKQLSAIRDFAAPRHLRAGTFNMDLNVLPERPDLVWVSQGLWGSATNLSSPACSSNCSRNRINGVAAELAEWKRDQISHEIVWQTNPRINYHPTICVECLMTETKCQREAGRQLGIEVFDLWALTTLGGGVVQVDSYHLAIGHGDYLTVAKVVLMRLFRR